MFTPVLCWCCNYILHRGLHIVYFFSVALVIIICPALWNQDDLIAERDEYNINSLKPGLTGWAQINGRDELPIPIKVQMDKVYYDKLSFWFDVKCLFVTVVSVFKHDGVVEGGTGQMTQKKLMKR